MTADPTKLKVAKQVDRKEMFFCIARSDDGRVFVGASDARIYAFDLSEDKPQPKAELRGHNGYVTDMALAENHLVSGAYDGRLIWWDRQTLKSIRAVEAHSKWIRGVTVTPDQKTVVSVADDMVCRLWDASSGQLIRELRGHQEKTPHHFPSMLFTATVSADGKFLATADKVGKIIVWDVESGKQVKSLEAPLMYTWDPKQRIHSIGGIRSLAFSPDGRLLAAGGISQIGNIDHLGALARIEVFDWNKGERTHEFPGDTHKGLVEQMAFIDGSQLLACGGDHGGFIKFIDLESKKVVKQDKAPAHIHDFVLSSDGESIYAAAHGKVVVWEFKA